MESALADCQVIMFSYFAVFYIKGLVIPYFLARASQQ
jgi:ferric iron reductase protein FhuF